MLPDFPSLKAPVIEAFTKELRAAVNARPLLRALHREYHPEGRGFSAMGETDQAQVSRYRRVAMPATLHAEEIIKDGSEALLGKVNDLAAGMAEAIEKGIRERLDKAASEGSPGVHVLTQSPTTFDEYLEGLEKHEIPFDHEGRPHLPRLVHSDPSLEARMRQWFEDDTCRTKMNAFLHRKKAQFDARESDRKLAD